MKEKYNYWKWRFALAYVSLLAVAYSAYAAFIFFYACLDTKGLTNYLEGFPELFKTLLPVILIVLASATWGLLQDTLDEMYPVKQRKAKVSTYDPSLTQQYLKCAVLVQIYNIKNTEGNVHSVEWDSIVKHPVITVSPTNPIGMHPIVWITMYLTPASGRLLEPFLEILAETLRANLKVEAPNWWDLPEKSFQAFLRACRYNQVPYDHYDKFI